MRKFFQTKRMMSFVCVLFTAILSLCSINIINYHDLLTTSTEEQTLNETDETNRGGEFTTSENENLDDVTANAPTNSGYWTDSGNYATSFAGGSGTSTNPYLISTPQQLARLAYLINGSSSSTYRALYYEQTTNLNMSAYWWDAIGYSSSYYFGGHYNGGGFTIAGLYTEAGTTSSYSYQGLFGYIKGTTSYFAEIHDVGIIDSNIQGYQYIGGIAGYAYSSSSAITNCYNTGSVSGNNQVGGIAGRGDYATITNCYNTGSVTGSNNWVGGIAGYAASSLTITNCYNTGSVTGSSQVGGIAGSAYSSISITNCYNTGSVTGPSYVGGIAGYAYSSTITNCYNTGSVTGSNNYVGGIAGRASQGTSITNCYNTGSVTGPSYVGGIAGYAYSSTITNCYWGGNCTLSVAVGSGSATNCGTCTIEEVKSLSWYSDSSKWNSSYPWDFENTWVIVSGLNDGYPVLQAFIPEPDNDGYWTDAGKYADNFAGGSGTSTNPYLISTSQQLARLAYLINTSSTNSTYRALYYEQTTNLNMSAYWWDAIGTSSYYFGGHYNGGGFTIAGLYTEAGTTSDYSCQGLFGYASGAEIHDVGIIDSNIQGYQFIGGIAGFAYSYSTITNCYNTGSVTGSYSVGGIAGYAPQGTSITNCYNTGSVIGSAGSDSRVGGIAGYASYSTITNCYNTGSVTGSSYVGGIAGYAYSSTITNCYNTGSVSGNNRVGGIAGYTYSSTIRNCYWGGNCTLSVAVGGGSATNCGSCTIDEVKSLSWYSDSSKWNSSYPWDFETVWTFVDGMNDGYPVLQAFNPEPDNDGYWTDAGKYADNFAGGSGTSTNPYLISTPQQLARLAYLINGSSSSSYRSLYYEQTTNLNMSAYWWDAIGYSSSYYFGGHYNGGGFTIAGLYTEAGTTSGYNYQGLFGFAYGAEIHDVGIIDSNIQGYQYIGGIAGRGDYATIMNCYNTGSVSGYNQVGGIAGYAPYSTITNCYNTGSVTGSNYYVGGIAGHAYSSTITNCYNTGSVTGSSDYVGGIAGHAPYSTSITNCYNTGSVTGSSDYVGGIAGYAFRGASITNCYNTGSVRGVYDVGGIAGNAPEGVTITNCYNTGSVIGSASRVGGIAGYTYSSTIRNCYWGGNCTLSVAVGGGSAATNCGTCTIEEVKSLSWYSDSSKWNSSYPWDFETVWVFMSGENDGYPVLRAFYMVSITFDANGGQGVMDDFKVLIGTSGILPTCTFIRTGYEFAGWATSSTGAVVYADGATYSANANATLYAKWTAHKYTVKFNGNGSTSGSMKEQTFTYGTAQKLTSNAFKKTGFTFSKWTRNADGTGTSYTNGQSVKNLTSSNGATINLYAQWTARNEAKYDSAGKYWYIENGKIPQTKVTNSTLISNLNKATTNGANYYIAGQTLTAKVYSGKEYCKWNNNWYEVEPIKWRLDASSSQTDGYGTTTDTNAVLAEIVYVDQYSSSSIDAGEGYSNQSVTDFMRNGISTTYLVNYATSTQTFGTGTSLYGTNASTTARMFVSSQSEINAVNGTMNITFSDLVEDMIKYYGGTNVYFTRDLGSNYNNIVCFNEVGREVQRFATDYRGVQFTVRFTEYGCVA